MFVCLHSWVCLLRTVLFVDYLVMILKLLSRWVFYCIGCMWVLDCGEMFMVWQTYWVGKRIHRFCVHDEYTYTLFSVNAVVLANPLSGSASCWSCVHSAFCFGLCHCVDVHVWTSGALGSERLVGWGALGFMYLWAVVDIAPVYDWYVTLQLYVTDILVCLW